MAIMTLFALKYTKDMKRSTDGSGHELCHSVPQSICRIDPFRGGGRWVICDRCLIEDILIEDILVAPQNGIYIEILPKTNAFDVLPAVSFIAGILGVAIRGACRDCRRVLLEILYKISCIHSGLRDEGCFMELGGSCKGKKDEWSGNLHQETRSESL